MSISTFDICNCDFRELNETEKYRTADMNIIFWGFSSLCKRILAALDIPTERITIWDTNKFGDEWEDVIIKKPELINPGEDLKQNSCVILAFGNEKHYAPCSKALTDSGYKHYLNGSKLEKQICGVKFKSDYQKYNKSNKDSNFMIDDNNMIMCLDDFYAEAGTEFNDYYLVQDLWAAKKVFEKKPNVHYDIGSRVDGFITHLLTFGQKTVLIDIRRLNTHGIENLTFLHEDATLLSSLDNDSIESISALCSLEHFGLGRYGDPVCPDSHKEVLNNMQRVLKKGGDMYISVPVSKSCKLVFNAHRVYSPEFLLEHLILMNLLEFSYTSNSGLVKNADIYNIDNGYYYGLFHFKKM